MRVRDVMTAEANCVCVDTPLNEALAVMQMRQCDHICVTQDKVLVGVISQAEVLGRTADDANPAVVTAGDLLSQSGGPVEPQASISQDAEIEEALQQMSDCNVRQLAVYGAHREMVGMVTLEELEHPLVVEEG